METRAAKRCRIAAPSITELLPVEVLRRVFGTFLGPGHYRYVAVTCRAFRNAYESEMLEEHRCMTFYESAAASLPCAELCLRETDNIVNIALAAARRGQIEVIKWANNHGCEWDYRLFYEAGSCGQLEVFVWAKANGHEWDFNGVAAIAAKAGHVEILDWIRKHTFHSLHTSTFVNCACTTGHLYVLERLNRHGLLHKIVEYPWYQATINGHIHVLDWLLDNECHVCPRSTYYAARRGQISVLQWALDHQVGWDIETCAQAAFGGQLSALKWLRNNGCPWDGNVIHWAQSQGHSDVVEWARSNDCPTEAEQICVYTHLVL